MGRPSNVENQNPRMRRRYRLRHAELQPQVDGRHPLPAHVAQAEEIIGTIRNLEGFRIVENFANHLDRHGEDFLAETEGDELRFQRDRCHIMRFP
jgi:hypothetical protein